MSSCASVHGHIRIACAYRLLLAWPVELRRSSSTATPIAANSHQNVRQAHHGPDVCETSSTVLHEEQAGHPIANLPHLLPLPRRNSTPSNPSRIRQCGLEHGAKSSAPTHERYYYAVASMDEPSSQLSGEMFQSATARQTSYRCLSEPTGTGFDMASQAHPLAAIPPRPDVGLAVQGPTARRAPA